MSSPREREKRDRRASRYVEGRKKMVMEKVTVSPETEEILTCPLPSLAGSTLCHHTTPHVRGIVKEEYLGIILGYFFLFLHKNICCRYSLEAPCRGTSSKAFLVSTHNICFYGELEKSIP